MNKKVMIIVLAVLLLLGIGIFLMTSKKEPAENTQAESTAPGNTSPSPALTTQNKSLKELMSAGGTQKCTFAKAEADGSNNVTIYMDNGKIRGDIVSVAGGKTTNSHMIVQGTDSYFWMEDQKTGMKMSLDTTARPTGQAQSQSQGVNPDEKVDYNCTGWSGDSSMFNLPADIQFSDFSKLAIPSIAAPKSGTAIPGTTDQCSACNYLSGDQKTQCLSALGCK